MLKGSALWAKVRLPALDGFVAEQQPRELLATAAAAIYLLVSPTRPLDGDDKSSTRPLHGDDKHKLLPAIDNSCD